MYTVILATSTAKSLYYLQEKPNDIYGGIPFNKHKKTDILKMNNSDLHTSTY